MATEGTADYVWKGDTFEARLVKGNAGIEKALVVEDKEFGKVEKDQ